MSGAESGASDLKDDELWGGNKEDGNWVDTFHFRREFGTGTIMDYQKGEKIDLSDYVGAFWRNDLDFSVINIIDDGVPSHDIVVSFWLKRGDGTGGTIAADPAKQRNNTDANDFSESMQGTSLSMVD